MRVATRRATRCICIAILSVGLFSGHVFADQEHSFGYGYRWSHLQTQDGRVFDFHFPTFEYSVFIGGQIGFLASFDIMIPVLGRQNSTDVWLLNAYNKTIALDTMLGAGYHIILPHHMTLTTGLGIHVNAMSFTRPDLVDFNSLTIGPGTLTTFRWRFHDWIDMGGNFQLAFDFADLLHDRGSLAWGMHLAILATVGVHFGGGDPEVSERENKKGSSGSKASRTSQTTPAKK